jgi:heme-degrading monooxygenase HmoA
LDVPGRETVAARQTGTPIFERTYIHCKNPGDHRVAETIILFRSRLTAEAGADYQAMNDEMDSLVRQNPGFVDVKSYRADDGERLTVVWWKDEASLRQWREQERHRVAQRTGRQKWYEWYRMEVATVTRTSSFDRP